MKILLAQRSLAPPGGGNAVAAWMLQALVRDHDVETLTACEWSERETNAFYGTSLPEGGIKKHVVPAPWRWLARLRDDRLITLRMCSLVRYARPLEPHVDLLITADNFAAFARPGIQYVHFPARIVPTPARMQALVSVYFDACARVAGERWLAAARNLTLANSQWTAAGLTSAGEVTAPIVLYPPVLDPGEGLPWSEREDAFLCIGRFHGSKRIELAMSIVGRARAAALPNARLIIVGSAVDREYTTRIQRAAARLGNWIEFREDLSRDDLNRLMGRIRYGLQAMEHEHFGMATAEMTRAGCLVFAHNSGGSPEVLNGERALLWETENEAVRKIVNLRGVESLRMRLKEHCRVFSTDSFVQRFQQIVSSAGGRVPMSAAGNPDR